LSRWDDDLSGLEEMPVDLYSNFGWKIEEAKGWEVRSSCHGEARIGGFWVSDVEDAILTSISGSY
jgi:hypothetical protein